MMNFNTHSWHPINSREEWAQNLFKEESTLDNFPRITEFYAGLEIFITGGSGFLGKVLIEKLLRSCPGIKKIFILLRPKKGKTVQHRLNAITALPLFDPIRKFMPNALHKLQPIHGDVSEPKLGLSDRDIELLKNVSIIFHSAASVRFDDPIKDAVFLNTRGTLELVQLALNMDNLKCFLHVSTTYCNPKLQIVKEELYPPVSNWRKTIEICENIDEDVLNALTPILTNFYPNTYTFTKNLGEHIVSEYKQKIPVIILRPSIVVSSATEPFPGWVDNFNGPIGLLAGSGVGIVRTMYSNPENLADFVPVDICIKSMIIAAWKRANDNSDLLPIINCASSTLYRPTMEQIIDIGRSVIHENPFEKTLWIPGGSITFWKIKFYFVFLFTQLLPAILVDTVLYLRSQKTFLTKIQRKIFEANMALKYFILHDWLFTNENFCLLDKKLRPDDRKAFEYLKIYEFDIILYVRYALRGVKEFLLGEKTENASAAKLAFKRMKVLSFGIKWFSIGFLLIFMLSKVCWNNIFNL